MGNRGKRGRRTSHANSRRGSTAAPARAYQSATPSKESSRRNLDFKISVNFHGQGAKATTGVPPPLVGSDERDEGAGDAEQHEQKDEEDKEHLPAVAPTRKSGRVIKKTWQEDFVFGSEMDEQIDCSPVRKADDEDNGVDYQSSPRKYQRYYSLNIFNDLTIVQLRSSPSRSQHAVAVAHARMQHSNLRITKWTITMLIPPP
jgi:hypothetical protein